MGDPIDDLIPSEADTTVAAADRGIEMLSAVHVLLNSERVMDEHDLLVSTCLEALDGGPADSETLTRVCNEIWPASTISIDSIRAALEEARELDLVVRTETLISDGWTLGRQGQNEVASTREWFINAMDRLARQIQDRAREDFGDVKSEVASNWSQILLRLFSAEIARSAASYAGEIERGAAGTIRPLVLDGSSMMASLDHLRLQEGTVDFLKGCLLAAVDESDPFGNELVGQVATSCVLHAVAARRARAGAQAALGSLAGKRVILDTPILVALLGTDASERRLTELVRRAVALDMEVVVPEHVFEELEDVLERVTGEHLDALTRALKSGLSARAYAQIVNEQLLELFLDGVEAKKYRNWNDLRGRARDLRRDLSAIGVIIRPHGNKNRENVQWIEHTLTESLKSAPGGRSAKAIARDAESVEMVWRARRRSVSNTRRAGLWPGGWMVSYDRRSGPAYATVNRNDGEPLVLTPAQWATLMTEAAPAAEIPELVAAAASYVRQESMLRIATKYPPAIALTLARSLSGEYSSNTDTRVAQLPSLGETLERAANGETVTGERLASELAARRANRLAAAGKEQIDFASLERARLGEALTRNTAVVDREHDARVQAEDRVRELEAIAGLTGRKIARAVILTSLVACAVFFVVIHFWAFAVGTAISAVVFNVLSRPWVKDPSVGIGSLFLALVPEVAGFIDIASRLGWFSG